MDLWITQQFASVNSSFVQLIMKSCILFRELDTLLQMYAYHNTRSELFIDASLHAIVLLMYHFIAVFHLHSREASLILQSMSAQG